MCADHRTVKPIEVLMQQWCQYAFAITIRHPIRHIMDYLFVVKFVISTITICSTIQYSLVNANDAEFGRVITFDNFDHFKVSSEYFLKKM